ncbi:MAG: helix-turn-helix domain-containing protein [Gemmataceae bacterium]|nr:helix-turn-helix domain-containing protein [Gemmataceae bacterium]
MNFGELLKQVRAETGVTQAELAERSGVSLRTIQGWEAGGRSPVSPDFFKVAGALGVEAGRFATVEARQPKPRKTASKKRPRAV